MDPGTSNQIRIGTTVILAFCVVLQFTAASTASASAVTSTIQSDTSIGVELRDSLKPIKEQINAGNYQKAEVLARELLSKTEANSGPDSLQAAQVIDVLVEALWRSAKYAEARSLAERALVIKQQLPGSNNLEIANSLRNLGMILSQTGDGRTARTHFERVLRMREESLGPEHVDVAMSLNDLGMLLGRQGETSRAEELLRRALAIYQKVLGPDDPKVAAVTNNLANRLLDGDYLAAKPLYERALEIYSKNFGPNHPAVANVMTNLGILHKRLGDYGAAKSYYLKAVSALEKTLGPDHPDVATVLNNLGNVLILLGERADAKHYIERALRIEEKALGSENEGVAFSLSSLAGLLETDGDYITARVYLERALAIWEKTEGPNHYALADARLHLANVFRLMGNHAGAENLYDSVVSIRQKLGAENPELAEALVGRSKVFLEMGELTRAMADALLAEKINTDSFRVIGSVLSEREALAYVSTRFSGSDLALSILDVQPQFTPQIRTVWDILIRSRAVVLDEMAKRHHEEGAAKDQQLLRLTQELTSARMQLARLIVRGPNDDPEGYRTSVERARTRKEQAERVLAENNIVFRTELASQRIGLADVASVLPKGSALVAFWRYKAQSTAHDDRLGESAESVPVYVAFVFVAGQYRPVMVPLGSAKKIEELVSRWRNQFAQEATAGALSTTRSTAAYRVAAVSLRRKIWDPLVPYLHGTHQTFIVPDGTLHLVSFGSLPIKADSYLLDRGPIHYLSAERDLVPSRVNAKGQGLLTVGAPDFSDENLFAALAPKHTVKSVAPSYEKSRLVFRGSRSGCGDFRSMRFEPLPGTAREVQSLASLWVAVNENRERRKIRADSAARETLVELQGAEANEAAVKDQAPGKRVLHFATHGFFLGDRCASALGRNESLGVVGENPLVLSGLALAGANHRQAAAADEEDGILTAEEVAALDLAGVEWAVLSACDTGVGEIQAGEGIFGLRRAFQIAGARTLIMSLWQVEDQATREWMHALYKNKFLLGQDTADSVRNASLSVLRRRRARGQSTHPFYWAGFVASGDWR